MPGVKSIERPARCCADSLRRTGVSGCLAILALLLAGPPMAVGQEAIPEVNFEVHRFEVTGANPLGAGEAEAALEAYLGEHAGLEGLLAAADELEAKLRDAGFAFHRVSLPGQTMTEGVVYLEIIEFTVSEITVTGNEHSSETNVRRALPELAEGQAPNTRHLSRQLGLANEHPSRRMRLGFSEGGEGKGIAVDVRVSDSKPWSVFASLDNTGDALTGNYRTSVGYQHTNLWDRDHSVTLSYTTSPDHLSDVCQIGAFYSVPLYGYATTLDAYFTDSDSDSGNIGQISVSGAGRVYGLSATHKLLDWGPVKQSVSVTLEDKVFDNNSTFLGIIPLGGSVRSRPVVAGYSGTLESARSRLDFSVEYARNTGSGNNNDDTSYVASPRTNASADWDALRAATSYERTLDSGWRFNAALAGQYGGEELISGEQFGIGGSRSVRGFEERDVVGDDGYRAGVEVWTPAVETLKRARFVGFLEGGKVWTNSPSATGNTCDHPGGNNVSIASVGVGTRWQWKQYLSVGFDVARVVNCGGTEGAGDMKAHLNVFVRY